MAAVGAVGGEGREEAEGGFHVPETGKLGDPGVASAGLDRSQGLTLPPQRPQMCRLAGTCC